MLQDDIRGLSDILAAFVKNAKHESFHDRLKLLDNQQIKLLSKYYSWDEKQTDGEIVGEEHKVGVEEADSVDHRQRVKRNTRKSIRTSTRTTVRSSKRLCN